MMLNPIEIACFYVVQPIIDFLAYLKNDVHIIAFIIGLAVIGILLGLVMGSISLVWCKSAQKQKDKRDIRPSAELAKVKKAD